MSAPSVVARRIRPRWAASRQASPKATPGQGQTASEEIGRGGRAEPQRADPGALAKALGGQAPEEQGRGDGRQPAEHPEAEQRGQRREEDRVAERVMARATERHSQRESLPLKELGAVDLRGQVGRGGLENHIDGSEQGGDHPRLRSEGDGASAHQGIGRVQARKAVKRGPTARDAAGLRDLPWRHANRLPRRGARRPGLRAPVTSIKDAGAFAPHFGGATTERGGGRRSARRRCRAGGRSRGRRVGNWLRGRLDTEGVDVSHFALVESAPTAVAFVTTDASGEPDFTVYGDGIPAAMASLEPGLEDALAGADGLFFGSNTLVGETEARVDDAGAGAGPGGRVAGGLRPELPARALAVAVGCAHAAAAACVPDALLVKCNAEEAEILTRRARPRRRRAPPSARRRARMALVTLGAGRPDPARGAPRRRPRRAGAGRVNGRRRRHTGRRPARPALAVELVCPRRPGGAQKPSRRPRGRRSTGPIA